MAIVVPLRPSLYLADHREAEMKLDEARLMANVNARAQRLFENGYRARWTGTELLAVRNSHGCVYQLDTQAETCDCPFFLKRNQSKSGHICKHILGWRKLLARQRACRLWIAVILLRVWSNLDDSTRVDETPSPAETAKGIPGSPGGLILSDRRT